MTGVVFDDMRSFIDVAMELGEVKLIEGADWNEEIGSSDAGLREMLRPTSRALCGGSRS